MHFYTEACGAHLLERHGFAPGAVAAGMDVVEVLVAVVTDR